MEHIRPNDITIEGIHENAYGSAPLGNGDLGANVWVQKEGIFLLLSKTDAWSELGRLLKTGLLNISLTPNPFDESTKLTVHLWEGSIEITNGDRSCVMTVYADANYPAYRVRIDSKSAIDVKVNCVNYRDRPLDMAQVDKSHDGGRVEGEPNIESADISFGEDNHAIGQYHRNEYSLVAFSQKYQGMEGFSYDEDPLINVQFGFLAVSGDLLARHETALQSVHPQHSACVNIYALCGKYASAGEWRRAVSALRENDREDYEAHCHWWRRQWEKCYVQVSGGTLGETITNGYNAQRYITLSAGRGRFPIKFNGSIFTLEPVTDALGRDNYDFREWGGHYWFQNTRLIYWSMLFMGDSELMHPFFKMYMDMAPVARHRTKEYYGHEGVMIPETVSFYGLFISMNYGPNRRNRHKSYIENRYIRYYFCGMIELSFLMLKYVAFTGDECFFKACTGFIQEVLTFFDQHFETIDGKLFIHPTSSLETWQDCLNDTPTIAGLNSVCDFLLERRERIDHDLARLCADIREKLPEIPIAEEDGEKYLLPFELNVETVRRNHEHPELYPVFPYHRFIHTAKEKKIAVNSYYRRKNKGHPGWQQDAIQAALLGLGQESIKLIYDRYSVRNPHCAFPGFWGPNYDWTPDQDHSTVACSALALSLVQSAGDEIVILPAWIEGLDVAFRLPVAGGGVAECIYRNGRMEKLDITGSGASVRVAI